MPCSHLRLSVPYLPLNRAPNILPFIDHGVEHTHFQSSTVLSTCQKLHRVEALQISADVGESKASLDSFEEAHGDGYSDYGEDLYDNDSTEIERRKNMGQWMRGNVPWNKGLAHSEETRKWISERTREALRDPKVKKKMREHPRPHSDEIKAKIGATQRKLWAKRLSVIRQKQKLLISWAENIAETAKKGGIGEQELEWDSYNKILEEMARLEIQKAEEKRNAKEKAKEMWKMRREAARAKTEEKALKMKERMKILAQKKIEREEKAKTRVKKPRRTKEKKEELALAQEKKLKQNLRKIRKRKGTNGLANGQVKEVVPQLTALEKLDLELIKKEKTRKEVSLADQLRAAKSRRSELVASDASKPISCLDLSSQRSTK